jgi:ATP-dependent helicase/nuclease subunit A
LTTLAPRVASALRSTAPPPLDGLTDEDRQVLTMARTSVARWVALADRLPPAELIDLVLAESAYDTETRGPGQAQARENLKKLRGLLRRIQNRGYATLARVSARLAQLMAGDESNAIVDAVDAVNLMTVHAAKGLEFPVVFVVNLSRGTGGGRDPIEVVTRRSPDGMIEDLVAIDGLADEVGDEIDAREREEAKRLLYVALTRARDRLYLSTALGRDGTFAPAPTALGQVLPATFGAALSRAGVPGSATLEWPAASGVRHVCRVVGAGDAPVRAEGPGLPGPPVLDDDFAPLTFAPVGGRVDLDA